MYSSNKRKKELARKKKQEEKRSKRQKESLGPSADPEVTDSDVNESVSSEESPDPPSE